MDIIEFLKRTDHRNLKHNIDYLVKLKFNELDLQLKKRRERLRELINRETHQYDLELADMQKAGKFAKEAKRNEWINLMRLQRERNENDLLQLKKQQREIESSEEFKHIRSREMLLESKQAQLHQIEQKKLLKEKEEQIEHFWLKKMKNFYEEKESQDLKMQNFRKCIADINEQMNLQQTKELKAKTQMETESERKKFEEDNIRAVNIDKKCTKDAEFYEWRKKIHHKDVLERQIFQNAINNAIEIQTTQVNANLERKKIQEAILEEIDKKDAQVHKNRAFQEEYLEHAAKEKKSLREREKAIDGLLIGTGCVLEQKEKRPYSKNNR